ncbi:E3 ubiquitin-protein ligase HRD1 [Bradysia coprophila]|uniref:E3 ubiquitin-protein ligase HRD1 n=1 Tax=Bradysia coprophila TaxID=38358 RepID=UPI00187DA6DB|nr:E3 ubiquitin-protein ligase HRD1 [Bradysia coprophila]
MRGLALSLMTMSLTAVVVFNAYYQKKQFYPSVVYITKSNPCMAVIYIQSLALVLMMGKLMRKIFLGTLRAAEFEHLMERFWYALTETCLAFTVFRDDFNPKFVALFTVLLFLKSFHWLAEDRVDYMERSPIIGWLFHFRVSALLTVLGLLDYMMISHAYYSTVAKGATVQLVFGFEYAILITMVINTMIKYILHGAEMRADSPWENKAVFLLYTELVIGLIRVVLYVLFVVIMVRIYTLPLFAFRPMYYTMRNFKKALNDVILSRRAINNMNTLYPDATAEELSQSDSICIICREDMVHSSKKLPCGHIFHTACLRSWFQRQQTCPTCRLNILRTTTRPATANVQNDPNANPPNPVAPDANPIQGIPPNQNMPQAGPNPFANLIPPPGVMFPPTQPFIPPFPMLPPFMMPPPMPPNLDTLSEDEIRALEGTERRNVEARIKLLRNVQLMMDASFALMNQYAAITANIAVNETAPPSAVPSPAPAAAATPIEIAEATNVTVENVAAKVISSSATDVNMPSTSAEAKKRNQEDLIKIEDLGSDDQDEICSANLRGETSEASELRRRRLQKFLQTEQKN